MSWPDSTFLTGPPLQTVPSPMGWPQDNEIAVLDDEMNRWLSDLPQPAMDPLLSQRCPPPQSTMPQAQPVAWTPTVTQSNWRLSPTAAPQDLSDDLDKCPSLTRTPSATYISNASKSTILDTIEEDHQQQQPRSEPFGAAARSPGSSSPRKRSHSSVDMTAAASERQDNLSRLSTEDRFLLTLKEDAGLPWKAIVDRFEKRFCRSFGLSTLQMRYKRMKDRLSATPEDELEAIRISHNWWKEHKWAIISEKSKEISGSKRLTPEACAKRWKRRKLDEIDVGGELGCDEPRSWISA